MSLHSRQSTSFATSAPDQRADGGFRTIRLNQRGVGIERCIAGIKMHLAVPIHVYDGVALTCEQRGDQRWCQVMLLHRDPEFCVLLHEGPESPTILSVWRSWADFFAKPALYREPQASIAGGGNAPPRPRRRGAGLSTRKPRFLKRRAGTFSGKPLACAARSRPRP